MGNLVQDYFRATGHVHILGRIQKASNQKHPGVMESRIMSLPTPGGVSHSVRFCRESRDNGGQAVGV